ncbi:alpha/beta fold hydrolase [Granulicella mallensis]|jgi:pimeloyl-ACP methyl ester carboxylesterase|uniref:Pimeloyl-ACP methyl ester carboxylesterase n=1 Tax=Granulicella mallensis TaxID=940614 RepID=A0A7W8E9P4_9BACT|nr:alpha/beta hydrolase [Granulicella mallensis]MBB5063799.1 pimeloyl-ACP methyl ester carboxylesterase [Granulicella mallensis]
MKIFRVLVMLAFVLGGIALLCAPSHAQGPKSFTPTRFTVVDQGTASKPDVILIPGLSSSRAVWDAEAKLLAPNYRLHLVQVDGFAGAPSGPNMSGPMLGPIVEELHSYIVAGKIHPVVIGHSLGGLLTLMLADKYPGDVAKIVIVDALPYYAVLVDPTATVANIKPQADAMGKQILAMPAAQFNMMAPLMAAQMVKNPEAQKLVAASSGTTDRAVMVNAMVEDLQTDLRGDVVTIKTPALMLYAIDASLQQPDPVKYEALVKDSYKSMPNVKLVRIDDSRHFIMYDQPEKFDAAVESFLK